MPHPSNPNLDRRVSPRTVSTTTALRHRRRFLLQQPNPNRPLPQSEQQAGCAVVLLPDGRALEFPNGQMVSNLTPLPAIFLLTGKLL
jgi:hypothetical protein